MEARSHATNFKDTLAVVSGGKSLAHANEWSLQKFLGNAPVWLTILRI